MLFIFFIIAISGVRDHILINNRQTTLSNYVRTSFERSEKIFVAKEQWILFLFSEAIKRFWKICGDLVVRFSNCISCTVRDIKKPFTRKKYFVVTHERFV